MTTTVVQPMHMEVLEACSEHMANKAINFCTEKDCPFNSQGYYCVACQIATRHKHVPERVSQPIYIIKSSRYIIWWMSRKRVGHSFSGLHNNTPLILELSLIGMKKF